MERRILQPEQIIVPGEYELGNESILKIYFRVFDRGHGEDLPPAIVINKTTAGLPLPGGYHPEHESHKRYRVALENYLDKNPNTKYFLLDGNHKTVASALCHVPIHVLELQSDSDIAEGQKLVESGDFFNWTIPGETLEEVMRKLGDHLFNYEDPDASFFDRVRKLDSCGSYYNDNFETVADRVRRLTSNGDIPQYMIERYHKGK